MTTRWPTLAAVSSPQVTVRSAVGKSARAAAGPACSFGAGAVRDVTRVSPLWIGVASCAGVARRNAARAAYRGTVRVPIAGAPRNIVLLGRARAGVAGAPDMMKAGAEGAGLAEASARYAPDAGCEKPTTLPSFHT